MNRSDDTFPQPGGTPDPHWQRAFDDAFETPPPRVWEGVERQLDLDESDGILPLWQHRQGRQSMLFGRWAAGIAASLLLTALGWWAWHREDAIRPDVTLAKAPAPTRSTSGTLLAPAGPTVASAEATGVHSRPLPQLAHAPNIASRQVRISPVDGSGTLAQNAPAPVGESTDAVDRFGERPGASTPAVPRPGTFVAASTLAVADKPIEQAINVQSSVSQINSSPGRAEGVNGTLVFTETTMSATMRMKETQPTQPGMAGSQSSTMSRSVVTRSMTMQSFSSQSVKVQSQFGQLPPAGVQPGLQVAQPVSERSVVALTNEPAERVAMTDAPLATQQLVLNSQDKANSKRIDEPAATAQKKRRDRVWVSAGVAASSFNPAVALRPTFSPTVNSFQGMVVGSVANASVAALQSQAGRGVAFQAGVGIPLGEHWSVETGVGYLNGQNQVQSAARITMPSLSDKSGNTANLYGDLVSRLAVDQSNYNAGTSRQLSADLIANQSSNYASGQQQSVSNAYQFVQVPVQVGYELRPRRKFGLALLTGLVSNWFVKNTVAESVTVKSGGGVYRPVTLAGTAGMRLRYRPDTHWSASVAGTFQQSLQSLTLTDVSLQATPQQVGVSFSVDRHF